MVRHTTSDDDSEISKADAFDALQDAREELEDSHVENVIATYDGDLRAAARDLRDLMADDDDVRDPFDLTPTDAEIAEAFGVDDVDDITDDMIDDVDVPDVPDAVDVSGYKTASGAAKATASKLREWADVMGYDPDGIVVYDPEETHHKRDVDVDAWCVSWEGGPAEWATALTGGESITAFSGPRMSYGTDAEVTGLLSGDCFDVECYFSFDILFFNR